MEELNVYSTDIYGGLSDLEPYNIDEEPMLPPHQKQTSDTNQGLNMTNGDVKKYPFIKIYEKYYVKASKDNPMKSQAMKIMVFIQANLDPFFNRGLIVLPIVKITSAKVLEVLDSGLPAFDWKNSKEFWLYGWEPFDKLMDFLMLSTKEKSEMKDEIKNLNESIMKTVSLYKGKDSPVVTISINDVQNKESVKCSFSPAEVRSLLNLRNIVNKVCTDVITRIIFNRINEK